MAILRQLLVMILVLALSPGTVELLENAGHLALEGHLAHASEHDASEDAAHAALEAEHGCTPMSHHCGCHISVPVVLPDSTTLHEPPRFAQSDRVNSALQTHPTSRPNAPPVPPPTA